MTKTNTYRFTVRPDSRLFFDTSIWLCIYPPYLAAGPNDRLYQNFYKKVLSVKARPCTNILVIQEYLNKIVWTSLRVYNRANGTDLSIKQFRSQPDFKNACEYARESALCILDASCREEIDFGHLDLGALDQDIGLSRGLCDALIVNMCRERGLTLVTDDIDMHDAGVPMVTENGRLLRN